MTDEVNRGEELFLGFDARLSPSTLTERWPLSRRREALLRPEATAPLSVDYLVWPSAWPLDSTAAGWRGPVQGLWDNAARLEKCLVSMPGRWWIVAIVLESRNIAPADAAEWRERTAELQDTAEWRSWKPLGYDVADRFLTSGTVWFRPEEDPKALQAKWRSHLNKRHLFSRLEAATQFRDYANKRAPEHAPHFVYKLLLDG